MKNVLKLAAISSLLILASFLISACGGGTENFVQGNGKVTVSVTGSLGVDNLKIEVHKDSTTGSVADSFTTATTATSPVTHDFQLTVGSDYYITITDMKTPARYTKLTDPNKITPLLTSTVTRSEPML